MNSFVQTHALIWVVYDGIDNAVFDGQVLAPARAALMQNGYTHVVIVSFEKKFPSAERIACVTGGDDRVRVIIFKKWIFMGMWSLWYNSRQLYTFLCHFTSYDIIARGALAGFIAKRAIKNGACKKITIQARGLLAEEYRYVHSQNRGLIKIFHDWRARLYHQLEHIVYGSVQTPIPLTIEVVTPALQQYLQENFGVFVPHCTLACADIPARISSTQVKQWRTLMRAELVISPSKLVYCFCGSVQPWQCPECIIDYFAQQFNHDQHSFLLVLTPDLVKFTELLHKRLPSDAYLVICVCHEQVYQYLAAADIGIIFREAGVISWVSRPVKAMEYEAVGLRLVHNNTVAWLIERAGSC